MGNPKQKKTKGSNFTEPASTPDAKDSQDLTGPGPGSAPESKTLAEKQNAQKPVTKDEFDKEKNRIEDLLEPVDLAITAIAETIEKTNEMTDARFDAVTEALNEITEKLETKPKEPEQINLLDHTEKTFGNTDTESTKENVPDIVVFGDPDAWKLICKASSQKEGWMKSTKALQVEGRGCFLQVTTQQRNPDGSYAVAEAVVFAENMRIEEPSMGGPSTINRTLVK